MALNTGKIESFKYTEKLEWVVLIKRSTKKTIFNVFTQVLPQIWTSVALQMKYHLQINIFKARGI